MNHFDESGNAVMVDVGGKPNTRRVATASSRVTMSSDAAATIRRGDAGKGDVLAVARLAGIMGCKATPTLIPLCHPLAVDSVTVEFKWDDDQLCIIAEVATIGRTGVEMEAMTAASVAALTVYDMIKSVDRWIEIGPTRLERKTGGKSGEVVRDGSSLSTNC